MTMQVCDPGLAQNTLTLLSNCVPASMTCEVSAQHPGIFAKLLLRIKLGDWNLHVQRQRPNLKTVLDQGPGRSRGKTTVSKWQRGRTHVSVTKGVLLKEGDQ
eukprot:CAMPEP_0194542514 /NCGR_PEP_ID=MMETSP0253-20130528/84157_1 /TAXON_ID=2966 /ORGANISM="Noctiluca scintillans" /LENGTH=101 /DNA_ID=CAMNT_0039389147 /DNA_START=449 /DNA_END=755 /DNA_ORIENTATION=+